MNANSPGTLLYPPPSHAYPPVYGGRNVLTIAGLQEALRQTHNLGYRDNLNFKMTRRRVASVPVPKPRPLPFEAAQSSLGNARITAPSLKKL